MTTRTETTVINAGPAVRRLAMVVLHPGDTIPDGYALVGVVQSIARGLSFVILEGDDLPKCAPGCRPVEFPSFDAMFYGEESD